MLFVLNRALGKIGVGWDVGAMNVGKRVLRREQMADLAELKARVEKLRKRNWDRVGIEARLRAFSEDGIPEKRLEPVRSNHSRRTRTSGAAGGDGSTPAAAASCKRKRSIRPFHCWAIRLFGPSG